MILCERYYPETGQIDEVDCDQVASLLDHPDGFLWIDLLHPSDAEFAWLESTFHFHPLAMEDVRNERQRAKIDHYEQYYFFVLRGVHYHPRSHRLDSAQLGLFVGGNFLVSVHSENIPSINEVRDRWRKSHIAHETVPFLFYLIIDSIIDSYFPQLDEIGEQIDDIDNSVLSNPGPEDIRAIFSLRRALLNMRRILGPMRDALNELIRSEEMGRHFAVEYTRAYFIDVFDHVLRLTDFVDTYRDMLSGSLEAYQSSLANKLNENMQRLTVGATVLATATVITGFYGMNLRGLMINSSWPYGGHLLLSILVVTTAVEIWLFYRKGWL